MLSASSNKLECLKINSLQFIGISQIETKYLYSEKSKVKVLYTDNIYAIRQEQKNEQNSKNVINIDSSIILSSISATESINFISNLQTESYTNNKNWELIHHDSFDENEAVIGWNIQEKNFCEQDQNFKEIDEMNQDFFLGGNCQVSTINITKEFQIKGQHKNLRINSQIHLFKNWEGESIFLFADDILVWQKSTKKAQNLDHLNKDISNKNCDGIIHSFGIPVDVIIPHKQQTLKLEFASSQLKHPCEASFAIDDVIIYQK